MLQYWSDYYMMGFVLSIRDIALNKTKLYSHAERKERQRAKERKGGRTF